MKYLILFFLCTGLANAGRFEELVETCGYCHGSDGNSQIDISPDLAGQTTKYLIRQLKFYRAGLRRNDMMDSVMGDITDAEIGKLSLYYSLHRHVPTPLTNTAQLQRGRDLYETDGTVFKGSCQDCHGNHGEGSWNPGNFPDFPVLAGQKFDYLRASMAQFRSGLNPHALLGMQMVVRPLSDQDLDALASYLSQLQDRSE